MGARLRRLPVGSMRMALALLGGPVLLACQGSDAGDSPAEQQEFGGVSREQLEQRAEPMTLEEAESLGIVDTTISVNPPIDPDSVSLPDGTRAVAPDTAP